MSQHILGGRIEVDPETSKLGLLISFGSIIMLFITLMATLMTMVIKDLDLIQIDGSIQFVGVGISMLLVISSVFYQMSINAWKNTSLQSSQWYLVFSAVFGILFLAGQIRLWFILNQMDLTIHNHVLAGMVYMIAGMHGFHIIAGLILLSILLYQMFNQIKINERRFRFVGWFWHFLTILWLTILSIFLIVLNI